MLVTSTHSQPNAWVALVSGAGLVCATIDAIIRGRTWFFRQRVTRLDDGGVFWLAVAVFGFLGIAMLGIGLQILIQ